MYFLRALFIFVVLATISGCTKYDDYLYEVVGMQASNANNEGEKPVDADNNPVPAKAYAIKLTLTMEARGGTGDNLDEHESGYANEERLASINVYALSDFDSTHAAGVSLNDYIIASPGGPLEKKIASGNIGTGSNQSKSASSWNSVEYLLLMREPQTNGAYSFAIDIGMSDGRHLIDTTSVILY